MRLPYVTAAVHPKQIGLIVLQADETLERDMRRLLPDDLEYLVTRIPSSSAVTSENLAGMEAVLSQAAELLPRGVRLSAVGYGCTSATAEIGAERVAALIRAGVPTPNVTEPVTALIAACGRLGLTRIGMVSPYIASVSERLRQALAEAGITVTGFASFEEAEEAKVVRISSGSVADAAIAIGQNPDCEAVFLSCTNLRTLDVIAAVEAAISKPVLSSNQVLAWHLVQLSGMAHRSPDHGALFNHST